MINGFERIAPRRQGFQALIGIEKSQLTHRRLCESKSHASDSHRLGRSSHFSRCPKIFGRDIATTESHIADRAEPKFGHRRQITYKATNGQFITAKSNGRSRMYVEKPYPEGSG